MKSKTTVCEEIVSPLYLPKHGRNERKVLNRTVCLLNLSNKFNIFIRHFVYSIDFQNTNISIVYVFIFFILSTKRDGMGIQRYNGAREMGKREKVFGKG